MQTEKVTSGRTGYCLFDGDLCFVDADPTFFGGSPVAAGSSIHVAEAIAKVLPNFRRFDGKPVEVTAEFGENAAARWAGGDILPVEAETIDGRWKLLSSHPRPDGGVALISTDITELKQAQIAHEENSEILRTITDSHPLPVWVIGEQDTLVLYESLPASKLIGRKWQPDTPQHLANHFASETQMADIVASLDENGIAHDQPLELRRADGSTLWCSANCRRGTHLGRPALIIGVLDITERRRQHDNEVALAREMLANAIESLSEGFALYDEDHRLVMCNRLYREMNTPVADLIRPGMKWTDMLRAGASRGMYVDAIGREEEWFNDRVQNRVRFQSRYEANLGNGKWHSVSIHPTDLGGFVVTRADISERKKAEASEREATALLKQVLDACPTPTRMSTIDGENLYRNPASNALYGDRPHISEHYVDQSDRTVFIDTLMSKGRIDDFRVRMFNAEGEEFWSSISARLIDFRGQRVIVANTLNISDMITAQQETKQANERLIDAIESLAEGFALYDKDDRLVLANSRYRKMHEICADILVPGVNWFDFLRVTAERNQFPVPKDKIDAWLAERAKDRTEFRQQEFQHTSGDWYYVSNCPTRDGGFVVTRMDITERKRAELAAKEAGEMVRRVLEACPTSILMTDAEDGRLLYRSPASVELLGEAANGAEHFVDPAAYREFRDRLLKLGAADDFETELKRNGGGSCWCSVSGRLIDFHSKKVIVSHTYDLTDHIRMQQELEDQRETLHQNEKMSALGGLLAGVAHELNNPLSVVLGLSHVMKETALDVKTAERADKVSKAAERCARIVKTFLAMARQQPARTSNVSVDSIIASAVDVAGYSIRSSDIELTVNAEPNLPQIWADPDQLSQVFINLLVNAEQALHRWDGERRIGISSSFERATGLVVVKVTDTGPGIPKEILPRIFEPFFTTKDVGSGTGIGLSFCHRIVQSHGGTIQVAPYNGGGTEFIISLPATQRQGGSDEVVVAEPPKSEGLNCLVIDDERDVRELIAEVLKGAGFRVTVADSGEEALRQLRIKTFSLILSDLRMPNMDGRRLFSHISLSHPAEVEKLAFLTGDTISPEAQAFLQSTKRPYLEKPVKPAELRAFVSRLVDRPEREEAV
jgi:signal transduction histidine kinase/ActR/RegA family two-component response regulator